MGFLVTTSLHPERSDVGSRRETEKGRRNHGDPATFPGPELITMDPRISAVAIPGARRTDPPKVDQGTIA